MEIVLIRHGQTEWTKSGRHTGLSDIGLTDEGRAQALQLKQKVQKRQFAKVFCSPLQRARETCTIVGLDGLAEMRPELVEWNYGDYEGLTSEQIRKDKPGWTVFADGVPNGETIAEVGERADGIIQLALEAKGDVALISSGHILRILAARWVGLAPSEGRMLYLSTASLSVLGYEREARVISMWNDTCHRAP